MAYRKLSSTGLPIGFGQCIVPVERARPGFSRTAGRKAKGVNCETAAACPRNPRNFRRFKNFDPGNSFVLPGLPSETRKNLPVLRDSATSLECGSQTSGETFR